MFTSTPGALRQGIGSVAARTVRRRVEAELTSNLAGNNSNFPGNNSNNNKSGQSARQRKAKKPGMFEVQIVTPPPQSLGVHAFPLNTHNGDHVQVNGEEYVVSSVVLQYKLVKGKYQKENSRLEVQRLSRYLTNLYLESMMLAAESAADFNDT